MLAEDLLEHTAVVDHDADFEGWRRQARWLLNHQINPASVVWQVAGDVVDLFADPIKSDLRLNSHADSRADLHADLHAKSELKTTANTASFRVPRGFVTLAQRVVCHRDADRFALLYRVLWRLTHGESGLLDRVSDDDVHRLGLLAKAVSRDRHKMTAFVRFRKTPGCEHEHYSAWFEPSHHILRLTSDFFCKRFSTMDWSIYTPEGSAHWNGAKLVFGPPGSRNDIPDGEVMEDVWRVYFSNIFNPARLRLNAMQSEMPVKYWKNLPEAPIIAALVHDAGKRTRQMIEAAPTQAPRYAEAALHRKQDAPMPESAAPASAQFMATQSIPAARASEQPVSTQIQPLRTLSELRKAAQVCERCTHACEATQTVFGQGPDTARIVMVGEQPGDIEDVRGRPFVGPAGKLLRSVLSDLSVDQDEVYFTNAVKHFKYTVRGKRRIHQTPSVENIRQCRSWLFEELSVLKPSLIIALGSTAARALLGRPVSIQDECGSIQPFLQSSLQSDFQRVAQRDSQTDSQGSLLITYHPARVLRASSQSERRRFEGQLREHLRLAFDKSATNSQESLAL